MLQRFLLVWLMGICLIAFQWPIWFPEVFDPFDWSKSWLSYLIAVTMFSIGALLPKDEVTQVLRRWPVVLQGTAIQYLVMPWLAYLCGHLFQLSSEAMIGIIIVGSVPGAMASNVLTFTAKGNVSYSVSLTTSATLLSPLIVPLVLKLLLQKHVPLDAGALMLTLLAIVVGPVIFGHLISRNVTHFERSMKKIGPILANLTILWIIAVVVAGNRQRLSQGVVSLVAALVTVNLLGYCMGYWGAKWLGMDEPMSRALTLEVGMQNAGLGTVLALKLFHDQPSVAIAPAMYTFGCMLTGTMLSQYWRMRSQRAMSNEL